MSTHDTLRGMKVAMLQEGAQHPTDQPPLAPCPWCNGVPVALEKLRTALEDLDATEPLGTTTEAVIDAAQRWYLDASPQAEPSQAIEDPVTVPRSLLGAACAAIARKQEAPKTLAHLRRFTTGDLSAPQAAPQQAAPLSDEQCDKAIAELGLEYLANVAANRSVLRNLCRRAHGIGTKGAK